MRGEAPLAEALPPNEALVSIAYSGAQASRDDAMASRDMRAPLPGPEHPTQQSGEGTRDRNTETTLQEQLCNKRVQHLSKCHSIAGGEGVGGGLPSAAVPALRPW